MAERALHTDLRQSLLDNDPYSYFHLVKFEKPSTINPLIPQYSYFTDAMWNINFDDGDGTKAYIASKLLKLGSINETIEAKASNLSITLASDTIGSIATDSPTGFNTSSIEGTINFSEYGFREGDKVSISGTITPTFAESLSNASFTSNTLTFTGNALNNQTVTINGVVYTFESIFSDTANSVLIGSTQQDTIANLVSAINNGEGQGVTYGTTTYRPVGLSAVEGTNTATFNMASSLPGTIAVFQDSFQTLVFEEVGFNVLSGTITISLDTEEIIALNTNLNYINREVFIYKGHLDSSGSLIGEPFLAFKGIISSGKLTEDLENRSTITWNLTSHWGDFVRVQGRLTSDASHRALKADGTSDSSAVLRDAYSTDKGFEHAEKAINLIATYNATETRFRRDDGDLNLITTYKPYEAQVERELDLNFNLSAKYLPVVYGVRKVDSIPVFVDLDNSNLNEVYVAYAICEGEIAGLYDIYTQDSPLVCLDASDENTRSQSTAAENVDVLCYGRADRGDVIAGNYQIANSSFYLTPTISGLKYYETTEISWYSEDETPHIRKKYYIALEHPVTGEELERFLINSYGNSQTKAEAFAQEKIDSGAATIQKFQPDTLYIDDQNPTWYIKGTLSYSPFTEDVIADSYGSLASAQTALAAATGNITTTHGLVHNAYFELDRPLVTKLISHTGKSFQTVDATLANVASNSGFKLQTDYYEGTPSEYWDDDHKLLDTAYVVAKYTIEEGETTIPSLDFIVKGKLLECYNYDGSFAPFDYTNNDTGSNFSLGDSVHVYELIDNGDGTFTEDASLVNARIIDKFYIHSNNYSTVGGFIETRYILDVDVSSYDAFIMYNIAETAQVSFANWSLVPDLRPSINPAMQLLDYLSNTRYGKGLIVSNDINLETFKTSALECDTRSDVTITLTSAAIVDETLTFGSGDTMFEGTVVSSTLNGGLYQTVLTDCIGKLGSKWNDFSADWTEYQVGDLIWGKNNAGTEYIVKEVTSVNGDNTISNFDTDDTFCIEVTTYSITGSASGALTGDCDYTEGTASGNPIVKAWNSSLSTYNLSGYSLYDSDDVKYWKYVGWDFPQQRWVTRHQCNQVIRTNNPLFSNVTKMLSQFNGILRYSNGLYELDLKSKASTAPDPDLVHYISEDDIIGTLQVNDNANKQVSNSISANIIDPQNKFEARSVSFFNSNYLIQDKGIPKQGSIDLNGITNYYNARFSCKQNLDDSRYKKSVIFKMVPKGYLLLAGSVIKLNYTRFGWVDKEFRISSINLAQDGLVQITADEHNDSIYVVPNLNTEPVPVNSEQSVQIPEAPTSLSASSTSYGTITLTWTNSSSFDPNIHTVEIWASDTSSLSAASRISSSKSSSHIVPIDSSSGNVTKYFWVRYSLIGTTKNTSKGKVVYSAYFPSGSGEQGIALEVNDGVDGTNAINAYLTNQFRSLPTSYINVVDYTDSGTDIFVFQNNVFFTYDAGLATNSTFYVTSVGNDITPGAASDGTGKATIADHSAMTADTASIDYTVHYKDETGVTGTLDLTQSITKNIEIPSWTITGQPESYTWTSARGFLDSGDLSDFAGTTFSVQRGSIVYTYDDTPSYDTDSFRYGTIVATNVTYVNTAGTLTIDGGNLADVATTYSGSLSVPIIDNNSGNTIGTKVINLTKDVYGVNWTVNGSNENHTFAIDLDGDSSATGFACTYTVLINGSSYTYDNGGIAGDSSFKFGTPTGDTGLVTLITNANPITMNAGSSFLTGTDYEATITVPIIDNYDGATIANKTLSFSRSIAGSRGGSTFAFEESTSTYIGVSDVTSWVSTLTNTPAQNIAREVITESSDGYIRPNDRITVADASANSAATRIYQGSTTNIYTTVSAGDFSSIVTEIFDGSVVVEGTLSADRLLADSTTTSRLYVGDELVIGDSGATVGNIHSVAKTSLADPDSGFFLQYDGQFNFGNSTNYIAWDGTDITLEGGLSVSGGTELSDIFPDATNLPDSGADVTLDQLSGRGPNILPGKYSFFNAQSYDYNSSVNATPSINTDSYFGNNAFQIIASGVNALVYLGTSSTNYNIPITPNKKWIFSLYVKHVESASASGQANIRTSESGNFYSVVFNTNGTANTWERKSVAIDLTSDNSTSFILRLDNYNTTGTMVFDGIMIEEQVGTNTTPSAYNCPNTEFAALPADGADVTVDILETGAEIDDGGIIIGTQGAIRSSPFTTTFPSAGDTGVWLGATSSSGKFYVGTDIDNYLRYDGSTLVFRGDLDASNITTGTITATAVQTAASGDRIVFFDSDNPYTGADIVFYDGATATWGLSAGTLGGLSGTVVLGASGASASIIGASTVGLSTKAYMEINNGVVTANVGSAIYGEGLRYFVGGGLGYASGDYNYAYGVVADGYWPLRIVPGASSSAPSHGGTIGTLYVTSTGVLYINIDGSTTWQKVGAQ